MHLLAVFFFLAFGVSCLALALWHEFTWWKMRQWKEEEGTVVGFSKTYDDGDSYHPEIEFEGATGPTRFFSKYGSSKEPEVGQSVVLLVSKSREQAEELCLSNRLLFTIIPLLFGVVFIAVALTVEPSEEGEPSSESKGDHTDVSNVDSKRGVQKDERVR